MGEARATAAGARHWNSWPQYLNCSVFLLNGLSEGIYELESPGDAQMRMNIKLGPPELSNPKGLVHRGALGRVTHRHEDSDGHCCKTASPQK